MTNLEKYEQDRRAEYDAKMKAYSERDKAERAAAPSSPECHPLCRKMPAENFGGNVLKAAAHDEHHENCPFHPANGPEAR